MILMRHTGSAATKSVRSAVPCAIGVCMMVLASCSTLEGSRSEGGFKNRVYVGAGALVSQLEPDTSAVAGASVDDSMGNGGSLTVGYDISSRISLEGHLASLGEAAIDPAGTIDYTVGGVSGVYYGLDDTHELARRRALRSLAGLVWERWEMMPAALNSNVSTMCICWQVSDLSTE